MESSYGDRRRRLYVYFYLERVSTATEETVVKLARACTIVGFVHKLTETSFEVMAEGRHDALTCFLDMLHTLPVGDRPVVHDVAWMMPIGGEREFVVRTADWNV